MNVKYFCDAMNMSSPGLQIFHASESLLLGLGLIKDEDRVSGSDEDEARAEHDALPGLWMGLIENCLLTAK